MRNVSFLFVLALVAASNGYLPVFLMHGYVSDDSHFDDAAAWIQKQHPGTYAHPMAIDNNIKSNKNLWKQIDDVIGYLEKEIAKNSTLFENGYHIVAHSQGGLIIRAILEIWGSHKVRNFVSLAGAQYGEYGIPHMRGMGNLEAELCELSTSLLYTSAFQNHYSVANMWRDYEYDNYINKNIFLPFVNNEVVGKQNATYTNNFLKIDHMYAYASSQDATISPWQSSLFGQYRSRNFTDTVPMEEQIIYKNDTFGLRTLHKQGRLMMTEVPGIEHSDWISKEDVFTKYVIPYLY